MHRLAAGSPRGATRRRLRNAAAAAGLLVALPGCACAWWRPESDRSLRMAREVFLGRARDDAAATADNVEGVPGWFEKEFRHAGPSLRSTFELYTDCPEGELQTGR